MKITAKIFSLILIILMLYGCRWFATGSFPFVESYNIPLKEDLVIEAITKFKNDNPQFNLPDSIYNGNIKLDLKDGRDKDNPRDFWYRFDFYDKEQDQIFFTWVREAIDVSETTFALVSIKKDARTGQWKRVNDELKGRENDNAIQRFETLILEPVKQRLQSLLPPGKTIENNNIW